MLNREAIEEKTSKIAQKRDELTKFACSKCKPPIKGQITKGKIKSRGLVFVIQGDKFWVEQRAVRITPVLVGDKIIRSSLVGLEESSSEEEIDKLRGELW